MNVERIRQLCKERGTNISQMEQALGFGNGTIKRWGDNIPSVIKVKAVADHLGVTVDDLLVEEEDKEAPDAED